MKLQGRVLGIGGGKPGLEHREDSPIRSTLLELWGLFVRGQSEEEQEMALVRNPRAGEPGPKLGRPLAPRMERLIHCIYHTQQVFLKAGSPQRASLGRGAGVICTL